MEKENNLFILKHSHTSMLMRPHKGKRELKYRIVPKLKEKRVVQERRKLLHERLNSLSLVPSDSHTGNTE